MWGLSGLVECVWKSGLLCLELDNIFFSPASSNFSLKMDAFYKIIKVVKFASKCFQALEWQPIRKQCYFFQNSVSLLWRKYHIYLHIFPPQILSRKWRKLFSLWVFCGKQLFSIGNNEGSCQQRRVIFFCRSKPRVKMTEWNSQALPWAAITWADSLQSLTALLPPATLTFPHHKRVGVPSGGFTASLLFCPSCVFHPHLLPRTSPPYGCSFFPENSAPNLKTKIQW